MSFDFEHAVSSPFRIQPGLRRLEPGAIQLTPNRPGARHLREKLAVLSNWPDEALLTSPGFDSLPALQHLGLQAAAEHPLAFRFLGGERFEAHGLGWWAELGGAFGRIEEAPSAWPEVGTCLALLPKPWRFAGLLALSLQEDLAIIDGQGAILPWLAVALPSHWAPRDKIGRHFTEVHAPIADNALLLKAGEHLMRLMTQEARWERFVWNITPHCRLNQHPDRVSSETWSEESSWQGMGHVAWFRTERQTFIPVPERQEAVFTIGVEVQPLATVITTPAQALALQEAVASMSPAVLAYRQLDAVQPALLRWLAEKAAGSRA
jgi:hypothetical protein